MKISKIQTLKMEIFTIYMLILSVITLVESHDVHTEVVATQRLKCLL